MLQVAFIATYSYVDEVANVELKIAYDQNSEEWYWRAIDLEEDMTVPTENNIYWERYSSAEAAQSVAIQWFKANYDWRFEE
jgi:hypothetical protein